MTDKILPVENGQFNQRLVDQGDGTHAPKVAVSTSSTGAMSDSGTHAYGYTNGLLTTDTWVVGGNTYIKTYTYTNGVLTAESDWVKQ